MFFPCLSCGESGVEWLSVWTDACEAKGDFGREDDGEENVFFDNLE